MHFKNTRNDFFSLDFPMPEQKFPLSAVRSESSFSMHRMKTTLLLMKVATHQLKRFSISTQSNFILLIEGNQIQETV